MVDFLYILMPFVFTGIFIAGIYSIVEGIICSQRVWAKIINISKIVTSDSEGMKIVYEATYKFSYNGNEYTTNNITVGRKSFVGEEGALYINPKHPMHAIKGRKRNYIKGIILIVAVFIMWIYTYQNIKDVFGVLFK